MQAPRHTARLSFAIMLAAAASTTAQDQATVNSTLPHDAGQVWREYDIRPYLQRVQGIDEPQQTIVNWILRDTGTDTWFREPFGLFSANAQTIRVYHVPEVQSIVAEIVERFVRPNESRAQGVSVALLTVGNPNWRSLALPLMRPVPVRTPGVDAWLTNKEHATVILSQLKARADFREHNSASVTILNGQSHTISRTVPRTFAKSISPTHTSNIGFQTQMGEIKEGYELTISPLVTLDGENMDAVIQCKVDQLEKLTTVSIELPGPIRGRTTVQVPQVASWRIHERFRWPIDEVLVISRSVVAMPGIKRPGLDNLPAMLASGAPRTDAILVLSVRSAVEGRTADRRPDRRASRLNYHGRY